jgi:hypothetical protein
MKKIILSAAAVIALAACGTEMAASMSGRCRTALGAAIDEKALVEAVNQSIDRKAVEGIARGALTGAVQEAIPPELRAVGAVIDEKALAKGIDRAIDGNALGQAVEGSVKGLEQPAGR